jgi:ADP-heptose:LPS heptosyltransferase
VGTDTGLTHLAVAYDRPTVAIFLSTAPDLTGPRGNHVDILAATTACAPCRKRDCPLVSEETTPPCVATVSPERVSGALHRALAAANGA